MRLTREQILLIGATCVLAGGFLAGVFYPQHRRIREARQQIALTEQQLQSDRVRAATVPELARQVEQLKRRHRNFDRRLPKQKELGEFLREISTTILAERLTDQVIEPGSPTAGALYNVLPIIMQFDGTFGGLANFLSRIDQMERLTRIESIIIEPIEDEPGRLHVEMQLNIYFTES